MITVIRKISILGKIDQMVIAVKIGKNKNIWMNHIHVHSSFEKHDSIIEFIGYCYTDRIYAILLMNAEYDMLHALTTDQFKDNEIFYEYFNKRIVEIINGMVRCLRKCREPFF